MASPALALESISETVPHEERVRQRAYEIYLLKGSEPGSELDDWFQAEQDVHLAFNQKTE